MNELKRYLISKLHPNKNLRRISRGGFDDVDRCKTVLQQVAEHFSGVMSTSETIDYICTHSASISRFGDGEYECIAGNGIEFQEKSKTLEKRLLRTLRSESDHCLIAFHAYDSPDFERIDSYEDFEYLDGCFAQVSELLLKCISADRVYGNALMSRLPVFQESGVENVKRLWDRRDAVLVTGKGSAFELDARLFHNLNSVAYVYGLEKWTPKIRQ